MATRKPTRSRRKKQKLSRAQFWTLVLSASVVAALCLLITVSGKMSKPFLPTWQELFAYLDGTDKPGQPLDTEMEVHVIDVGNADSVLVRNKGKNLLIDAGSGRMESVWWLICGITAWKSWIMSSPPMADADHIRRDENRDSEHKNRPLYHGVYAGGSYTDHQHLCRDAGSLNGQWGEDYPAKVGANYALGDAQVDILGPAGDF